MRTRSTDTENNQRNEREKTPEVTIRRKVVKPSTTEGNQMILLLLN